SVSDSIAEPAQGSLLQSATLPLYLRDAHYRISDNFRLRPCVFNAAFGDTNAHFDVVQLGNTLMVASCGEIAGVFYWRSEKEAAEVGLNLILIYLDGGYIRYMTLDDYYNRHYHEVLDLNWFGLYNCVYFYEIMMGIIDTAVD